MAHDEEGVRRHPQSLRPRGITDTPDLTTTPPLLLLTRDQAGASPAAWTTYVQVEQA